MLDVAYMDGRDTSFFAEIPQNGGNIVFHVAAERAGAYAQGVRRTVVQRDDLVKAFFCVRDAGQTEDRPGRVVRMRCV